MKILAPLLVLFALIQYTAPNGFPIFISRDQIIAIVEPSDCVAGSGARITTSGGTACIRETVQEALTKALLAGDK